MPIHPLKQLVDALHPFPGLAKDDFARIWQPFSAKRKTLLTVVGEQEHYLYFVVEGV